MTRKDYVLFAAAISDAKRRHPSAKQAIDELAIRIADLFAADNDRFDRKWFYSACGLTID